MNGSRAAIVTPQRVQIGSGYAMGADGFRDSCRVVEQGENIGIGQHAAQRFDDAFAAAHSQGANSERSLRAFGSPVL